MKRLMAMAAVAAVLTSMVAAADPVTPANLILTNFTDVSSIQLASEATFYQGDTLSLSNSVMYAGADTNATVQNLEGCIITVTAGGSTETVTAEGYAISTNAGTWGAEFTIPAENPCYIEVSVSNVYVRTYEQVKVATKPHLGD